MRAKVNVSCGAEKAASNAPINQQAAHPTSTYGQFLIPLQTCCVITKLQCLINAALKQLALALQEDRESFKEAVSTVTAHDQLESPSLNYCSSVPTYLKILAI